MHERVFVISDLHLGGASGEGKDPGFQMCTAKGRVRLCEFIRWAASHRTSERGVHLVVAGDIVDFLAEEDPGSPHGFRAFTANDADAQRKLVRILERTDEVWQTLRQFCESGARLTLMIGNHDVELGLPAPRRELLSRLSSPNVEFLHDGEALSLGPVLIDHGNRADSWNQIDHDTVRELRSEISRGEPSERTLETPGSELVVRVMNGLKKEYGFVDLLKPETSAVLPLLAVLEPASYERIRDCARLVANSLGNKTDATGKPRDSRKIAGQDGTEASETPRASGIVSPDREEQAKESLADLDIARELATAPSSGRDTRQIGGVDSALGWADIWRASGASDRATQLRRLRRGLRRLTRDDISFNVNREEEKYLRPARAAIKRGFRVVLFGHTHLVKRAIWPGRGVYLNTGTWADLIQLPALDAEDAAAVKQFEQFAEDLACNRLTAWRRQRPTFAQIDRGEGEQVNADVFELGENGVVRVPDSEQGAEHAWL